MNGQRVKQARKNKNMTVQAVADQMGVTHVTVSRWESGMSEPNDVMKEKLAKVLGVSVSYLIGYDNNEETSTEGFDLQRYSAIYDRVCAESQKMTVRQKFHAIRILVDAAEEISESSFVEDANNFAHIVDRKIIDATAALSENPHLPKDAYPDYRFELTPYANVYNSACLDKDNATPQQVQTAKQILYWTIDILASSLPEFKGAHADEEVP